MANEYYERLSEMNPGDLADGLAMEAEFDAIAQAFGKLPTPHTGGQGFEGPVRVGDATNPDEAINKKQLEEAMGTAKQLAVAAYGNFNATAWATLPSGTYLLFGTGSQITNSPFPLAEAKTYYLTVRHAIGDNLYFDAVVMSSLDDDAHVDIGREAWRAGPALVSSAWRAAALKKGALAPLEALTPAADKIAVFNGSAGAELITLTPFMRELLDDADDDSALGTLGAAAVGHGHDGAYFGVVRGVVTDFNNALTEGLYYVGSSGSIPNAPYASAIFGRLVVYVSDAGTHNNNNNWIWQYFMNAVGDQFLRYKTNSSPWSAWVRDFNGFNIVGTVSQVGGLCTGAIIETSGNGNGLYTKFADGTLFCQVIWDTSSWPANGNVAVQWTFPHPFSSEPNCFANIKTQDPDKYWASVYTYSGNGTNAMVCAGGLLAGSGRAQYMAYGRWY